MHFVAGILDRAGAHPAPDQHNVFGRRVVEAVPAAARRIDYVAFARRLIAMIGVDYALPPRGFGQGALYGLKLACWKGRA